MLSGFLPCSCQASPLVCLFHDHLISLNIHLPLSVFFMITKLFSLNIHLFTCPIHIMYSPHDAWCYHNFLSSCPTVSGISYVLFHSFAILTSLAWMMSSSSLNINTNLYLLISEFNLLTIFFHKIVGHFLDPNAGHSQDLWALSNSFYFVSKLYFTVPHLL